MERPIRILHVVTHMERGGLETMLMNYYRNIDRTKVQFDFLVHREYESAYDKEILSLGGKIYHISRLIPWSKKYKKELKTFLNNHKEYQIIHVHQDCLSSIALKCAKECGIPIRLAHSHSKNQDINIQYIIKKIYMKKIPKYTTNLFACSKEAGDWMFSGAKYHIINNAILTKKFIYNEQIRKNVRKKLKIKNELILGHVGRFNYPKNHEFIVEVFYELHKINQNSKLLLIGTGKLKNNIESKVGEFKIKDDVIFLENRNDINELMQAMDAFIFPSLYEGLGIVAIEAQATGLQVYKSNNVPQECVVTPNVYSLSLEKSAKFWAENILEKTKDFNRCDTSKMIKKEGYDIEEQAVLLQNFYLNEVKKYESRY